MVMHTFNIILLEAEAEGFQAGAQPGQCSNTESVDTKAGRLQVQSQSWLHSKTLSQEQTNIQII